MNRLGGFLAASALALGLAVGPAAAQGPMTPEQARAYLGQAAASSRAQALAGGYEAFRARVVREPGPNGVFIVNGDTPIVGEAKLRAFYEGLRSANGGGRYELTTGTTEGGDDDLWDDRMKFELSYCVSTAFGARHGEVVQAMRGAAAAWEAVAQLRFIHVSAQDGACDNRNDAVLFDVSPGPEGMNGAPYARAFFPSTGREERNVLIWQSSFQTSGRLTLEGILRHELGHVIGLRHEHTRPEAGECFEDNNWRGVTTYDAFSVMHYPQCNGKGDWSLELTAIDRSGIACVYGPAAGFTIDQNICTHGGGGAGGDPFGGDYGAGAGTGHGKGPIGVTLE